MHTNNIFLAFYSLYLTWSFPQSLLTSHFFQLVLMWFICELILQVWSHFTSSVYLTLCIVNSYCFVFYLRLKGCLVLVFFLFFLALLIKKRAYTWFPSLLYPCPLSPSALKSKTGISSLFLSLALPVLVALQACGNTRLSKQGCELCYSEPCFCFQ